MGKKTSSTMRTRLVLYLFVSTVMFLLFSCKYSRKDRNNVSCPTSDMSVDSLVANIEYLIIRNGCDDSNAAYCFVFKNGRKCIFSIDMGSDYQSFCDIGEDGSMSPSIPLENEYTLFERMYSCNPIQAMGLIDFCRNNDFSSVSNASRQCIVFRSAKQTVYYSRDSALFDTEIYLNVCGRWFLRSCKSLKSN